MLLPSWGRNYTGVIRGAMGSRSERFARLGAVRTSGDYFHHGVMRKPTSTSPKPTKMLA